MKPHNPEQFGAAPDHGEPKDLPLDLLRDEAAGLKAIAEARKPWENTLVLLSDKWRTEIAKDLHPADIGSWNEDERHSYLEGLGRLLPGLVTCDWHMGSQWEKQLLGECRRLSGEMADKRAVGVETLIQAGGIFTAVERNTNTAGASARSYDRLISEAAAKYESAGDAEAVESLVNPYRLTAGTELIHFDRATGEAVIETIQDIAVGTDGVLAIGDQLHDLKDLNKKLALGMLMLKSGDNMFGGLEFLRAATIDRFQTGQTIGFRHPLEDSIAYYKIIGSNQAQLEAEYGQGYLQFAREVLVLDLETPDGKVSRGVNLRDLSGLVE